MKRMLIVLAAALAVGTIQAKTTQWVAPGGGNFSEPANWSNGVPGANNVSNDTVILVAAATGVAYTNDLDNLVIAGLKVSNTNSASRTAIVRGNTITIKAGSAPIKVGDTTSYCHIGVDCNATIYTPIHALGNLTAMGFNATSRSTYRGTVTVDGTSLAVGPQSEAAPKFYAPVIATNATIQGNGNGRADFYSTVKAKRIYGGHYWSTSTFYFQGGASSIDIADMDMCSATYYFKSTNPFVTPPALTWDFSTCFKNNNGAGNGNYDFQEDAAIDRIEGTQPPYYANGKYVEVMHVLNSGGSLRTLTLKATKSTESYAALQGKLSIVYDPADDDFYQTFSNRTHTMSGTITVKRGAVNIAGDATFKNVTALYVRGGTLELDSSSANAFAAVTTLFVGENATFRATDRVSGTLFKSTGLTAATIEKGGAFEIPAGTSLTANFILAHGAMPLAGVYTGKGNGEEGVTECDWIVGGGRVTVVNTDGRTSWKAPVSGNWSDATKWSHGLPSYASGKTAYVTAHGADYTVTVDGDEMPFDLQIGNSSTATTVVSSVSSSFAKAKITIGRGGRLEVPAGGKLTFSGKDAAGSRLDSASIWPQDGNTPVSIKGGGEFRVSGGTATFTKYASYLGVGSYDGTSAGLISVTAGRLNFSRDNALDRIVLNKGGRIEISGTGEFNPSGRGCVMGSWTKGGQIVYRDSARLVGNASFNGQGETTYDIGCDICGTDQAAARIDIGSSYNCGYDYEVTGRMKTTVNVTNAFLRFGEWSSTIGGGDPIGGGYSVSDLTGILNVWQGGNVYFNGSWNTEDHLLGGLSVGYGASADFSQSYFKQVRGELNVRGGAFTNALGNLAVGVSHATGQLLVDGGSCTCGATDRLFMVGLAGGTGDCLVKKGSLEVNSPAYFGGPGTNMIRQAVCMKSGWQRDNHGATGTFRQEGGTAAFAQAVYLGVDGSGILEQVGSEGTFTAGSLVFSNTVYNAASGGTAKFTLDANGARTINLTDKLVLGANAKLVVDTSAYPANGRGVCLIRCPGGIEGEFSDVELTGAFAAKARLVCGKRSVRLKIPRGLMIILK